MYTEDKVSLASETYGVLAFIPFIVFTCLLTSKVLLFENRADLSLIFNPFSKIAQEKAVEEQTMLGNYKNALILAKRLESIAPGDLGMTLYLSQFYDHYGDEQNSLKLLKKAYELQPILDPQNAQRLYDLTLMLETPQKASDFFHQIITNYQRIPKSLITGEFKNELDSLCQDAQGKACQEFQ